MTHENSGQAGHSAAADADEESDVAGNSAAAIVDERGFVFISLFDLNRANASDFPVMTRESVASFMSVRWQR